MNYSYMMFRQVAKRLLRRAGLIFISSFLALSFGCTNNEVATDTMLNVQTANNNVQEGLLASISTETPVVSIGEPIIINFELTNHTAGSLSVLSWGTPLETEFTREIFKVTRKGAAVKYIGRKVKRGSPQDSDFVTLLPGESIQEKVDLREGYQIDALGEYLISLNLQYLTTKVNGSESLHSVIKSDPISIRVVP